MAPAAHSSLPQPVDLLWLESTRSGTAAGTHFRGTLQRLTESGIPIRNEFRSEEDGGGIMQKMRRLLTLVRRARRAADGGVLIARWHPFLAFVSPRWLRRGGRVMLLVQGNDESTYEANPWFRRVPGASRLMAKSLSAASSVLTVNRGLADWVREDGDLPSGTPIAVLPSGVSDVFFDAEPAEAEPAEDDRPYALFFGGLAPWQGVDYMLEAHSSASWPADVRLLVIGDGARADAVRAAVPSGVEWLGALPPRDVARYVAGAVCTLCPKVNTGSMALTTTPFKILESVAAGIPVVATDIPAQADMLSEGYGILVSGDHPPELAEAVARMAHEDGLRARLVGRAREVAPRLRWAAHAPQLADAIRSL